MHITCITVSVSIVPPIKKRILGIWLARWAAFALFDNFLHQKIYRIIAVAQVEHTLTKLPRSRFSRPHRHGDTYRTIAAPSGIFPPRISPPPRVLPHIPINTRPIDQPQRIGFQIPPRRRIIIPHPVLVQAGFGLEPLAGEAEGRGDAARSADSAEREIGQGPDLDPPSLAASPIVNRKLMPV